jgi:outer membrane protein TolC
LTQAKLATARAKLHLAQAQGAIDGLRATLSRLTGVPAQSISTVPDSVPELPAVPSDPDVAEKAAASSPAVLFAEQHATAESFRARAEHRNLWPSVDFAAQYAVLAKFNNWLQFFPNNVFQRNNATIGVVIRFPFFNAPQAADAEAVRARSEAQSAKSQVSQENLRMQHAVQQLQAAQEVSQLEYEIAQSNASAVDIRLNSGTATVNDQANARTEVAEKYDALQDANFELLRARVALLRATGDLQAWVNQGK